MEQIYKDLTKEIKRHNCVILMAHKNIDLDAFGSLLCLYEIVLSFNKQAKIVMNKTVNASVKKAMRKVTDIEYCYKEKEANETDLLIVADTHKENLVENINILKKIKDKIVLDHHVKDANYIKDTIASYIDSNASSTVEIIIHYLKSLNKVVNPTIASIMLAGLEIDTNSFDIKTTDKTYETAAMLYRLGSNNALKKELLQQNKEEYIKRQALLKHAHIINKNIAICVFTDEIYNKEDLSIIANELLQFDNVEVGFAIGKIDKQTTGISGKSLSNFNVEEIMHKLGGGGHFNNAATQLKRTTLKKAEEMLLTLIEEDI
ncbi:MAG: DHH family phosphoesterase [Bacilli bacterium]|nr:DHH family phosphoesterase [Bacilli bacterium]